MYPPYLGIALRDFLEINRGTYRIQELVSDLDPEHELSLSGRGDGHLDGELIVLWEESDHHWGDRTTAYITCERSDVTL